MAEKKTKRKGLIAALAVLVVALAVGGTVAWLTAQDQLTNTFTVGSIGKPDKPANPDEGDDEDKTQDTDGNAPDGYLFETEWDESSKPDLTQGVATAKNPNVGIKAGEGEQSAYVFLYVKNDSVTASGSLAKDAPYFFLEKQWTAVTSSVSPDAAEVVPTVATNTTGSAAETAAHSGQTAYVDGLFMYTGDAVSKNLPAVLDATRSADGAGNVYTGELFEDITIPNNIDVTEVIKTDGGTITVYAFIYAADSGATGDEEGTANDALKQAVAWAKDLKNPAPGA